MKKGAAVLSEREIEARLIRTACKKKGCNIMAYESSFTLMVSGSPKVYGAQDKLIRAVSRSALMVDNKREFESTNFAGLNFRFVWSGVVRDINRIDDLHKLAVKSIKENLLKWEYRIIVKYAEKGDVI